MSQIPARDSKLYKKIQEIVNNSPGIAPLAIGVKDVSSSVAKIEIVFYVEKTPENPNSLSNLIYDLAIEAIKKEKKDD